VPVTGNDPVYGALIGDDYAALAVTGDASESRWRPWQRSVNGNRMATTTNCIGGEGTIPCPVKLADDVLSGDAGQLTSVNAIAWQIDVGLRRRR